MIDSSAIALVINNLLSNQQRHRGDYAGASVLMGNDFVTNLETIGLVAAASLYLNFIPEQCMFWPLPLLLLRISLTLISNIY